MATKIETFLPPGWSLSEYSELNHHITLTDDQGHAVRLDADRLVKYTCSTCEMEFFTKSNHGAIRCGVCGEVMDPVWSEAQICFLPGDKAG